MTTVYMVLMIALMIATFGGFFVGLFSLFQLFAAGRRAGHSFWSLYFFGVYRYAFTEKKGSPETRRMVRGFVATAIGFVLLALVGALLEASRHS
jgi:hypothetical protein